MFKLFALQIRVITALLMREIHTRYGRENIGHLWVIGEPLLFCVGVAVMWTAIRPAHEHGLPVTAFVITGYVPLTMWRHCVSRSVKAFEANGSLLFHRQVTPLDIIVSRCVLEIIGALIAGIVVSALAILVGYMELPADMGLMYLGLFYQAVFCLACALILAPASEISPVLEKFVGAFTYLMIPFSGAFVMVDWVPQNFQSVLLWSPPVHAAEIIRKGQFGSTVHAQYDLVYLTYVCAGMILFGISLTLRSRKHILVQ
ncbi:MAG: ABC transporter permease [Janthinobacterium lividum]